MSFGARLRHERERRKISIASIAETTKILGALLEGVEHDDVSRWPTGFYRRAFMRAYAGAIGLDPEATVKEFVERFPDPEAVTAAPSQNAQPAAASPHGTAPTDGAVARTSALRVAAPRLGAWFSEGPLVGSFRLRCLAAGLDLFAVCVLGLASYVVLGVLWAPLCLAAAAYYAGSILLLGNTPGVSLFADPEKTLNRRGRVLLNFLRPPSDSDVADSRA